MVQVSINSRLTIKGHLKIYNCVCGYGVYTFKYIQIANNAGSSHSNFTKRSFSTTIVLMARLSSKTA